VRNATLRSAVAGVGLIEVLITLVIIAGGVLALSRLQGVLVTSAASSRQQSDASFIAQRVLEDLRSRNWTDTSLAQSGSPFTLAAVSGATATYSVQYTVTDIGAAGQMQYKTVQVTVSWTDAQGQTRAYAASTRLQRIGPDFSARLLS
jgi:type IV pilus modification protein PilV